jgi:hypothetical protein
VTDKTTYETRQVAVQTLTMLVGFDPKAGPPKESMEHLSKVLDPAIEHSAIVRHAALQAIPYVGQLMPPSPLKEGIVTKMNMLANKDKSATVRIQAHISLILFKGKYRVPLDAATATEHLKPIEAYVTNQKDPTIRKHALQAFQVLGPAAQAATQTVISALDDSDLQVSVEAMVSLIYMQAFAAIPRLQQIARDPGADAALKKAASSAVDELLELQKLIAQQKLKKDKK